MKLGQFYIKNWYRFSGSVKLYNFMLNTLYDKRDETGKCRQSPFLATTPETRKHNMRSATIIG